jgi:hypothetical protein
MKNVFLLFGLLFGTCVLAQNKLSRKEKKNGWSLLFDGNSLNNWRSYKNLPHHWEVSNGTLHNKNNNPSMQVRSDLITEKKYSNFELSIDWKIPPGSNSGLMYRASEEFSQPYYTGPEYQMIDNEGYQGKLTELQKTAANYDMEANTTAPTKPIGQWNNTKILVQGNYVEHWLNGQKVLDYTIGSTKWNEQKEKSKWKTAAKYGSEPSGHIALQDHGHEIWFKNVKIKVL